MDESRLILDASKGDLDAFNYLVLKYQDLVFSRAYGLLGDCHSAEDAAQESFLKAFQNIRRFRGGSFRAWLYKIVTNLCYDEMRWYKRHPTTPLIPGRVSVREWNFQPWLLTRIALSRSSLNGMNFPES
jgi:RNA polymerase sigma-70 factor (ECF subfamily)